jgi:putative oxidoreductase
MDVVFFFSRILFTPLFLAVGVLLHRERAAAIRRARALGVPSHEVAIPAAEVALIVGAVSVAFGIFADIGALLVLAVLIPATYFMYPFWKERSSRQREAQYVRFLLNTALVGGTLLIFWSYNQLQDAAPISITDPFFGAF